MVGGLYFIVFNLKTSSGPGASAKTDVIMNTSTYQYI